MSAVEAIREKHEALAERVERRSRGLVLGKSPRSRSTRVPEVVSKTSTAAICDLLDVSASNRPSGERQTRSSSSRVLAVLSAARGWTGTLSPESVQTRIVPARSQVTSVDPSAEMAGLCNLASWPQSWVNSRVACRQR